MTKAVVFIVAFSAFLCVVESNKHQKHCPKVRMEQINVQLNCCHKALGITSHAVYMHEHHNCGHA